jgi:hypothetical protein
MWSGRKLFWGRVGTTIIFPLMGTAIAAYIITR